MPVKTGTVKIFLGNLSDQATTDSIRPLFEAYGKVVEADVIKNYGFVHMEDAVEARRAIADLHGHELHGKTMVVEMSTGLNKRGVRRGSQHHAAADRCKIFVGNVHKDTQVSELKSLFAEHGGVVEADIISNYAFVHMDGEDAAQSAITAMNGSVLHGQELRVQMSTSSVRQSAGMDKADMCFRCGSHGHWSKDCGRQAPAVVGSYVPALPAHYAPAATDTYAYAGYAAVGARDRGRYAPYPAYTPLPTAGYRREVYYDPLPRRDAYYEVQPYCDVYDEFDLYNRRRAAPLPPVHDPYGPPPAAAARRYEEALYDRRVAGSAYRVPQPAPRRMY